MIKREFKAAVIVYPEVSKWVEDNLKKIGCPMKILMQISMCLEEIYINIAHYAYGDKGGMVNLGFDYSDNIVTLQLRDRGIEFNPLAVDAPKKNLSLEDRKEGGFGIYLVREMMDKVEYTYENGENVLTFRKRIW